MCFWGAPGTRPTTGKASRSILAAFAATPLLWLIPLNLTSAQEAPVPSLMAPGDGVVTGFSGVLPPEPPPPAGDPLDETFINLDGPSMQIQHLVPNGPPSGQLIDSPTVFKAPARSVGQVFAITLDDAPAPNIYLGATSAFGLQIVLPDIDGQGHPKRVKTGQPGAEFMAGQWGQGGTAGSIYRVDGSTGAISVFTTIGANSGPGLGDVVFDKASHQFFVSDLDTGLIYRLDSTGLVTDTFDHGVTGRPAKGLALVSDDGSVVDITSAAFNIEDPATWGYTQKERMVYGLAMHGGRLYYAVADGPQIWSVGINLDGTFANDPRWELDVAGLASTNPVSDIAFDNEGRMILAQRGLQRGSYDYSVFAEPKQSSVVRYRREIPDDPATPGTWVPVPEEYAIGFRPDSRNTTGGIALGYGYDASGQPRLGSCNRFLWTAGESLRDNPALAAQLGAGGPAVVHGLQGNDRDLVRPANDPPFQSYFTDYDGKFDDPANQGHMGDVEIWQPCETGQGLGSYMPPYIPPYLLPPDYTPPPPSTFNLTLDKEAEPYLCLPGGQGWVCSYTIRVTNTGSTNYWGPITVDDWLPGLPPGAVMSVAPQPPWLCGPVGAAEYYCTYPPVFLFPGESVDLYVTINLPAAIGLCYLDNAAKLFWPIGYGDANPGDDVAFDSAQIPDAKCKPPYGDTTNLKIEKSAKPKVCEDTGANWKCSFLVTVTNTGPGAYSGDIEVTDSLSVPNPPTVSPPPWACVPAGPGYMCTYPDAALNPGDSIDMLLTTTVPKADLKAAGKCSVMNDVAISKAPGGSALNLDPADDTASAEALAPGENCEPLGGAEKKSDLSIKKEAKGCVLIPGGWFCAFTVTLTNEGPDDFYAPLKLHEWMSVAPIGAPVLSPPWICAAGGGGYDCDYPAGLQVPLAPLDTMSLDVGLLVPDDGSVCSIDNTASIATPLGGTDGNNDGGNDSASATNLVPSGACPPIAPVEKKSDLKIEKSAVGDCTLGGDVEQIVTCQYQITVTNLGPDAYDGSFNVNDIPSVGEKTTIKPSDASWTCSAGPGKNATCQHLGKFEANVPTMFSVQLEASLDKVKANGCKITNQVFVSAKGDSDPGNDKAEVDAILPNALCHPPVPKPQGNLKLLKFAEPCQKDEAGGWKCDYQISISNLGPEAIGPVTIQEVIPDDPEVTATFEGDCQGTGPGGVGPIFNCTKPNIKASSTLLLHAHLHLPDSYADGVSCKVPNTAKIVTPAGGSDENSDKDDDSYTAIAKIDQVIPNPDPGGASWVIPCDPPALHIEKVAKPEVCTKVSGGFECSYDVKVTSVGKDPYHGTLEIDEIIPVGSTLKSFSAPWKCAGAAPAAHCSHPFVDLAPGPPGEFRELKVTIAVPDSFATSGQCAITNEVHTSVAAAVLHSDKAAQYMAKATAKIPADVCGKPAKVCPITQRMPNGGCCPDGERWNGRACTPLVPPKCPDGTTGTPPDCKPSVVKRCPAGSVGLYPDCRCPGGTRGTPPDCKPIVVKRCPAGSVGDYPDCRCPGGTRGTPPDCKPIVVKRCPAGSIGVYPDCRCPRGTTGTPPNCKPIVVKRCPAGSIGVYPDCRCPRGTTGTPPDCKPIVVKRCPAGSIGVYPDCRCPRGTRGTPPNCMPVVVR